MDVCCQCEGYNCPIEVTISLIGGKYKAIILWHLINKTLRFNQLQKLIPQATAKMLTQQLRELERDRLVERKVYPVVPPRTEYSLTEQGQSLSPVLMDLCHWGKEYLNGVDCVKENA